MNSKKIMIAIGIVVIVAGSWIFFAPKEEKSMMTDQKVKEPAAMEKKDDSMAKKDDAMMKSEVVAPTSDVMMKDESAMMTGGQYAAYSPEKIAFAKEGKVVLFFRASWCPTCKALDANIRSNAASIPKNVLILDVDYDVEKDLKKKYGVVQQHTLVQVDASGNALTTWVGSSKLKELLIEVK